MYLYSFIFIFWSSRMTDLLLCFHSIAPCTSKNGISAQCYLSYLGVILVHWYIVHGHFSTLASSCYGGGLSCNSSFCFAASRIQPTNRRQWIVPFSLLFLVLIYFSSLKGVFAFVRRPTATLNVNKNNRYFSLF